LLYDLYTTEIPDSIAAKRIFLTNTALAIRTFAAPTVMAETTRRRRRRHFAIHSTQAHTRIHTTLIPFVRTTAGILCTHARFAGTTITARRIRWHAGRFGFILTGNREGESIVSNGLDLYHHKILLSRNRFEMNLFISVLNACHGIAGVSRTGSVCQHLIDIRCLSTQDQNVGDHCTII